LIAVLDSPDESTATTVRQTCSDFRDVRLLEARFEDPALARNLAISTALARAIAVADGDDLLTSNWIAAAMRRLNETSWNAIVHPELVMEFGASSGVTRLPDMDRDVVPLPACLTTHFWISTCVAPIEAFRQIPYLACGHDSAFGYEDWHWTCAQIAAGRRHVTARDTALLYRKKAQSLLRKQESQKRIVRHTMLFSMPELLQTLPLRISAKPELRPAVPSGVIAAKVRAVWAAITGRRADRRSPEGGSRMDLPKWLLDELRVLAAMDEELALHWATTSASWTWWYPNAHARLGDEYVTAYKRLRLCPETSSWRLSRSVAKCRATKMPSGLRISVTDTSGAVVAGVGLGELQAPQLTCDEESYLITRLVLGLRPCTLTLGAGVQLLPNHTAAIRESGIGLEQGS
jgi:hypothetical protein